MGFSRKRIAKLYFHSAPLDENSLLIKLHISNNFEISLGKLAWGSQAGIGLQKE